MAGTKHNLTVGGRVNEDQLARIDAATRLARMPRAHFIVEAALERANRVLREVATSDAPRKASEGS